MPIIEVTLVEGRSPEQLRTLIAGLTSITEQAIAVRKDAIRVIVREVRKSHFAAGDVTFAEREQLNG